jgi:trk system potassium uptake protein TrkA
MKIVIVGCGRVGSTLAESLDADGHEVIIFDVKTAAFDRLPETFKGAAVRGDGTDEEVLRRNGAEDADIFLSLTEGDNRNIMSAQVAMENLRIPQVIAKINDPVRAAAYAELGVVTLCRTNLMVDSVSRHLNLGLQAGPGIDVPDEGHRHPHRGIERTGRSDRTARATEMSSEADEEDDAADESPAPRSQPSSQPAGRSRRADGGQAQRLGFRRWRG